MTQTADTSTGQAPAGRRPASPARPTRAADPDADAEFAQATKAKGPPRTSLHPRAHPRCGPGPLHRAGLRRHQPAGDRRALGVTKAALYYHFETKEDILMALHMRLHEFGKGALMRDGRRAGHPGAVGGAARRDRRPDAGPAEALPHARAQPGCAREAAPRRARGRARGHPEPVPQDPPRRPAAQRDRVRMAAGLGVVFSGLFLSGDAFADADAELGDQLRASSTTSSTDDRSVRRPFPVPDYSRCVSAMADDRQPTTGDPAPGTHAPLHAGHRHRRHRSQGQRAGRDRGVVADRVKIPTTYPLPTRAAWWRS